MLRKYGIVLCVIALISAWMPVEGGERRSRRSKRRPQCVTGVAPQCQSNMACAPAPFVPCTTVAETCPISFVGEFGGVYWHYAEYYNPTCNDATPTWWPDVMELTTCPFWCGYGECILDSSLKATTPLAATTGTALPADGKLTLPGRPGITGPVELLPRLVVGGTKVIRRWQISRTVLNRRTGEIVTKTFVIGIHARAQSPIADDLEAVEAPLPGPNRPRPAQMKLVRVVSTGQLVPVLLQP